MLRAARWSTINPLIGNRHGKKSERARERHWSLPRSWEQRKGWPHTRTAAKKGSSSSSSSIISAYISGSLAGWQASLRSRGQNEGGRAVAHARVGTAPFPTHLTRAAWRQKRGVVGIQVRGRRGGANGTRAGALVAFKGRRRSSVCQSAASSRRHRPPPPLCLVRRKLNTTRLLLLLLHPLLLLSSPDRVPQALNADVEEQENTQREWLWRSLPRRSLQRVSLQYHMRVEQLFDGDVDIASGMFRSESVD